MKRSALAFALVGLMVMAGCASDSKNGSGERRISLTEYRDKMKAGWVGQMAGVAYGAPTEFKCQGVIIPEAQTPKWDPNTVNGSFEQDDLYVDMTFLRTLEVHGLNVSIRQAGIDFANSGFPLWHANDAGRTNLRKGIAPPDSGHPQFNKHADDIDYQIEADFAGLVSPGLPNTAIQLGEKFGRVINYGDGLYAGQFMGGMYAEAFFETDPVKIVEAGLQCVPQGSQLHECISDVLAWYKEDPNNWQKTWQKVDDKYQKNPEYRKFSCDKGKFNIDAKINAAYVVMGMLYGKGDLDQSMAIACRCGQDSDCNPSSAAGVMFTTIGFSKLPAKYKEKLDESRTWIYTAYNFPKLIAACEKVARQAVVKSGGRIEKDANGEEYFVLPKQIAKPSNLELCWKPGPIANSRYTPEEMAQIKPPAEKKN
ncbi:MAG: ADP-ribosylglycohydrolase family protein [Bacillota bacterium]